MDIQRTVLQDRMSTGSQEVPSPAEALPGNSQEVTQERCYYPMVASDSDQFPCKSDSTARYCWNRSAVPA